MDIVEDHRLRRRWARELTDTMAGAAGGGREARGAGRWAKREVAEMIGGELELPALWCAGSAGMPSRRRC